jgi:hypothetical protein
MIITDRHKKAQSDLNRRRSKIIETLNRGPFDGKENRMDKTPILSIDLDGVLHSYTSGWKGPRNIPDPPVKGAIPWLRSLLSDPECICAMAPRFLDFDVQIFSSRSRHVGGRRAIKKWLFKQFVAIGEPGQCIELLKFPLWKPPAFLHIDDRAWLFTGSFPTVSRMKAFKPWNKGGGIDDPNFFHRLECKVNDILNTNDRFNDFLDGG